MSVINHSDDFQAGWGEGYRPGINEGLCRALPRGYDVGTPENPWLQFTNVVARPGGEIFDESVSPPRKHNPTSAWAPLVTDVSSNGG